MKQVEKDNQQKRFIITFTEETRSDTVKTRRVLEAANVKSTRTIVGKTILDSLRSKNFKRTCKLQNMNE